MNKIIDKIYLGCWDAAINLPEYNPFEITHVLNCTKEFYPDRLYNNTEFTFSRVPINDGEFVNERFISTAVLFIQEAVINNGRVLVHCQAGISRSPSMVAAYLMTCGFSWDEAIAFINLSRSIFPHPEIKRSVMQFFGLNITAENSQFTQRS